MTAAGPAPSAPPRSPRAPTGKPVAVAVIGDGAAGLHAGIAEAREGARTVVHEHVRAHGKEASISGDGREEERATRSAAAMGRPAGRVSREGRRDGTQRVR